MKQSHVSLGAICVLASLLTGCLKVKPTIDIDVSDIYNSPSKLLKIFQKDFEPIYFLKEYNAARFFVERSGKNYTFKNIGSRNESFSIKIGNNGLLKIRMDDEDSEMFSKVVEIIDGFDDILIGEISQKDEYSKFDYNLFFCKKQETTLKCVHPRYVARASIEIYKEGIEYSIKNKTTKIIDTDIELRSDGSGGAKDGRLILYTFKSKKEKWYNFAKRITDSISEDHLLELQFD